MPDGGSATSMDREINANSILELDKQIIHLQRSRNSLLNVARVPSEILGHIFRLSVKPKAADGPFAGLGKRAYNFLLVCNRWFEVARSIPDLRGFWGNSLEDWGRQYPHSGPSPLDLVLDGVAHRIWPFGSELQGVLRGYAVRDAIRTVHLRDEDMQLLTTIISTLTPEDDGTRDSSIESIILDGVLVDSYPSRHPLPSYGADASDFLSRHRFTNLRDLSLSGYLEILPRAWDCLRSHTAMLVNLSVSLVSYSSIPTTSQILSLLASNPNIRSLTLALPRIGDDSGSGSESRVPLRHLENLTLKGGPHHVFSILQRLELPERVDHTRLEFHNHTSDEVKEVIAPRIRDYLHRDPRFKNRLGIFIEASGRHILLRVSVVGVGYRGPDRLPPQGPPHTFFVTLRTPAEGEKLCIDILALLPRESIVYFETTLSMTVTKEVVVAMPNLEALCLVDAEVSDGFLLPNPDGPNAHTKLLPSLRRLYLRDAEVGTYHDWIPLVRYVTHQTPGNHPFSLLLIGKQIHICSKAAKEIKGLVAEFVYDRNGKCPRGLRECRRM
jgi:hypothetical protein